MRLGNEIIILGDVLEIVQGKPYERLCKINKEPSKIYRKPPIYQFLQILVTRIKLSLTFL
jgi:hypothetical protein